MPKVKTNKGASKRFAVTAGGKVKIKKAYARHILTDKSRKRKRNLRGINYLSQANMKEVKKLMPYSF